MSDLNGLLHHLSGVASLHEEAVQRFRELLPAQAPDSNAHAVVQGKITHHEERSAQFWRWHHDLEALLEQQQPTR